MGARQARACSSAQLSPARPRLQLSPAQPRKHAARRHMACPAQRCGPAAAQHYTLPAGARTSGESPSHSESDDSASSHDIRLAQLRR